jgi:hypothetical protein
MKLEKPKNENYCATVVELKTFVDLPNCDNVKAAIIFNNQVIVGKECQPGDVGLFFPLETALSKEFLGANNLFRKPELGNRDPQARGFFEENGRVRCVKFRGHKSEGFFVPLSFLSYIVQDDAGMLTPGMEFDTFEGYEICHKYISKRNPGRIGGPKQGRLARLEDKLLPNQFRFHIDTGQLRKNAHRIVPEDLISITDKWHGTSVIFGNLLVRSEIPWYEKVLRAFGIQIADEEYAPVWASRRVVKGVGEPKALSRHYYNSDIWGIVGEELRPLVPKGYTIYAEIVGWTPEGSPIQKGYSYSCAPGTHRTLIYRITHTTEDGDLLELSWKQVKDFCAKRGLEHVKQWYHGPARGFYPGPDHGIPVEEWQAGFLRAVENAFIKDDFCPFNDFSVPAEGVVVKVERLDEAEAYKIKNYRFLEHETKALDKGETDIEAEQEAEANGE